MSDAPPSTATSIRSSPTATRRSRRRSLEWAPATSVSLACIASLPHVGGQEVEELLGGELGRVVALSLKKRPRQGVLAGELGEGQVVGVGDDRGDRAVEPEHQEVGPALDLAQDLVEVPAGPPDPNGLDLAKIHGLLSEAARSAAPRSTPTPPGSGGGSPEPLRSLTTCLTAPIDAFDGEIGQFPFSSHWRPVTGIR